ncbi:MAG: ferritin family protein [Nitrospirota bacterium]
MPKTKSTGIRTIKEVLEEAIKKEEESAVYYENLAVEVGIEKTRRKFLNLAERERKHASELKKMLDMLSHQVYTDIAITGGF